MNRLTLLFLATALMLTSCTTNYLVVSETETPIYTPGDNYTIITTIPSNKAFLYSGKSKPKIKYGLVDGDSPYLATWRKIAKLNKKQVQNLTFTNDKGYTYNGVSASSYGSGSAGNKSSTSSSSDGTVHVKGYTRKNGIYVAPHTRSAPRRH